MPDNVRTLLLASFCLAQCEAWMRHRPHLQHAREQTEVCLGDGRHGWKMIGVFYGENWPEIPDRWTSQVGQDKTVVDILGGRRNGYFVDLAANDAVSLSNTLTLEQEYDWDGLCVEPMSRYIQGHMRRRCALAVAVAGGRTGETVTFKQDGVLSGIVGANMDNKNDGGNGLQFTTVSVAKLFRDFGVPKVIDYMSLDIEGAEYYTFKDFPWDEFKFWVLTVERPKELRPLLEKNGYVYVKDHGTFGDALFVHNTLPNFDEVMHKHKAA